VTQADWKTRLDQLCIGASLRVPLPVPHRTDHVATLVAAGFINGLGCDQAARWVFDYLGLDHSLITAPSWGYTMRGGVNEIAFYYWCFDPHYVGIYVDEAELKRPKGGDYRGMWDRCFVIPDMPIPEPRLPIPDHLRGPENKVERVAWLREGRPRRHMLDALALAHFIEWLQNNEPRAEERT